MEPELHLSVPLSTLLPQFQGIRRLRFVCFSLIKIYSKCIKNIDIKLASLESIFQYKSNHNIIKF
jgi:hypothetical protein